MVAQAFSDSPFAPESEESHGSFIIMVDEVPLFWRSGRQSLITVSTAESELAELTESMTAGESVAVLFEELFGRVKKVAWCDSQAVITILVSEGGSWRTRHLRMRSAFARQAVMRGEWQIAHQPGEKMIADIGTKSLSSTRPSSLKEMFGMKRVPTKEAEEEEYSKEENEKKKGEDLRVRKAVAVQLIVIAAQMSLSRASEAEGGDQEEEEQQGEEAALHMVVFFYTLVVVVITILIQRME